MQFKSLLAAVVLFATAACLAPVQAEEDPWVGLRADLFGTRTLLEEVGVLSLDAPVRAEDAATVPITIRIGNDAGLVKSLTLVVDRNPVAIAGVFAFGDAMGAKDRTLSTRLRFDNYSNIHAVLEKADGTLYVATKFVKAAGGCSAPALKDADEALANLGKSQVRLLGASSSGGSAVRSAVAMVRHPNYTGMQMNQETGYFIPPKYVTELEVTRGGVRVFKLDAGISISADPNFRFTVAADAGGDLALTTKDSDGNVFSAHSPADGS